MDHTGSIKAHRCENPPLHHVDDEKAESALDHVGAHGERDVSRIPACRGSLLAERTKLCRGQNLGKSGQDFAGRFAGLHEKGLRNKMLPILQRIGSELAEVERFKIHGIPILRFG